MKFCPERDCEHYGKATKYQRICFYEVNCWRGFLDMVIAVLRIRRSI